MWGEDRVRKEQAGRFVEGEDGGVGAYRRGCLEDGDAEGLGVSKEGADSYGG